MKYDESLYGGRPASLVLADERTIMRLIPSFYQCMLLLAALFLCCLAGCGKSEPITMIVTHVDPDKSSMGCMGVDWRTYMRSEDGRIAWVCGNIGEPGTKVRGWWTEGAMENGFSVTKP